MGTFSHGKKHNSCTVGPALLVIVGLIALFVETGHLNPFNLLHWYIRWWPLLLICARVLALSEWWVNSDHRNPRYCSSAAGIAFIICCLAYLASSHNQFGIYVSGHLVNAEDIAHLLAQE
jgi:hypothetical protein